MEIFRTCPNRPWGTPSLLYNGYRVFPGGKEQPGRDADPSALLVPWSRKGGAIPLLPPWPYGLYNGALYLISVPVQGCTLPYLNAYTRVYFTLPQCLYKDALYLISVPVQGCTLPYLSDCTRVHFNLPQCLYKGERYLTSVPVQGCTLPYLSACTRVHCTLPQCLYKGALYLTSLSVQGCTLPYLSACTRVHFTFFTFITGVLNLSY